MKLRGYVSSKSHGRMSYISPFSRSPQRAKKLTASLKFNQKPVKQNKDQLISCIEVMVKARLADASSFGNVVHTSGFQTVFCDAFKGRTYNLLAADSCTPILGVLTLDYATRTGSCFLTIRS